MNKKLSMDELNRLSPQEFTESNKNPFIFVLDNVRSMHNVGSAFRTADSFGLEKIILTGITAQPPHKEITKTALGADQTVLWQYFAQNKDAIEYLISNNYKIVAIEQVENSKMLQNFNIQNDQKYAFVFGNEVFGVEQEWIDNSHEIVEIPQFGTKHSLNVSVTLGIVAWHALLQTEGIKSK